MQCAVTKPAAVNGDGDELMDIPSMPGVRRRLLLAGVPRVAGEPERQVIKSAQATSRLLADGWTVLQLSTAGTTRPRRRLDGSCWLVRGCGARLSISGLGSLGAPGNERPLNCGRSWSLLLRSGQSNKLLRCPLSASLGCAVVGCFGGRRDPALFVRLSNGGS